MKALFIWNEDSVNFIKGILKNTKQFADEVKFITSQELFDNYLPKVKSNDLSIETKKEITNKINEFKSYTKIYILAELNWEDDIIFEGYSKGFEILEKWGNSKAPIIEFFSIAPRILIKQKVEDILKFLVRAFNFNNLTDINTSYKFNTEPYNKFLWNSFKYLALTSYGILDNLGHRLESIQENSEDFKLQLDEFIQELSSYNEFIGSDIINFIKKIEYNNNYVKTLELLISRRIYETSGDKLEAVKLENSLKILIVDDNQNDIDLIEKSLRTRYQNNHIKTTTSGEEAIKFINDGYNTYDLIITDLELLDKEGFYQNIQGVEVFNEAMNNEVAVAGVITGLGRKGISKLLNISPNLILPKKHIHRFDIDEELDNLLRELLKEYKKKENRLDVSYGPKKGILNKKGFKNALSRYFSIDNKQSEVWNYAYSIVEKFKNHTLSKNDWNKELKSPKNLGDFDEFITEKFHILLSHRLILIFLAVKNNFFIYKDQYENDYYETLERNEIITTKSVVNTACIKYESETEKGFKFSKKELFPEELKFINEIQEELKIKKSRFSIKDHSPATLNWIKSNFKFDAQFYHEIDITPLIDEWEYEDLEKVWKYFKELYSNDKIKYENILENILEHTTKTIENELDPILPNILNDIDNIGKNQS